MDLLLIIVVAGFWAWSSYDSAKFARRLDDLEKRLTALRLHQQIDRVEDKLDGYAVTRQDGE
jgi:hypothetical protein